jgi:hypothetical protein
MVDCAVALRIGSPCAQRVVLTVRTDTGHSKQHITTLLTMLATQAPCAPRSASARSTAARTRANADFQQPLTLLASRLLHDHRFEGVVYCTVVVREGPVTQAVTFGVRKSDVAQPPVQPSLRRDRMLCVANKSCKHF